MQVTRHPLSRGADTAYGAPVERSGLQELERDGKVVWKERRDLLPRLFLQAWREGWLGIPRRSICRVFPSISEVKTGYSRGRRHAR
jgi:hypothetical protein